MLIRRQMEAERRKPLGRVTLSLAKTLRFRAMLIGASAGGLAPNATYFRIFLNRRPDNKGFGMELARAFLADF
jgi:hypothetical protein